MTFLNDLYNKISEGTPVIRHQINGVITTASEEERVLFLTNAAIKMLDKYWLDLRKERDMLLKDSDWTQVADTLVNKNLWATYRQALRDIPANTEDPSQPVWPTPPI